MSPGRDRELYGLLFDDIRIEECDGSSQLPRFSKLLRWCSPLGCVIQACDQPITAPLYSSCVTRPSLFLSVTLSADWKGCEPESNLPDVPYGGNMLLAIAMRDTTHWVGKTPCCDRLQSVGIAIPASSLEKLGLGDCFEALFDGRKASLAVKASPLPPALRKLAEEMLTLPQDDILSGLRIDARAMELVARSFLVLGIGTDGSDLRDRDRAAVRRVRDMIESDLARNWALPDLAKSAGLGARSLNTKFRQAFGTTVFDYLKQRRLELAHDVLSQRKMSVSEVAYHIGYESPANFATAFRRHFGYVPSSLRRRRSNLTN
ncbi:MAG: helix-turn-helix transcriptional regulator [Pseudomonadota bacterium]